MIDLESYQSVYILLGEDNFPLLRSSKLLWCLWTKHSFYPFSNQIVTDKQIRVIQIK